ncbi:MAG TPA: glycosyltransferase [Caulobacteraceae bacterium]|nr:glycosyltransferase [Caulobacteraceae bacterium]
MRAVLLKGPSQYEGTRTFIDHAAAALARRGYRPDVVDLQGVETPMAAILEAAAAGPPAFVFSINMLGEARDGLGRTMGEIFEAPHVVWHVDYILSQEVRLAATPASAALLMVDPTQVEALASIYGRARFPNTGFCPHAAVGEVAPDDADAEAFAANRPIPILWCGTLQKLKAPPWADADAPTRKVFDDATDLALSVEWMAPHEALDQVLASRGLDLADPENQGARQAARFVDVQVRVTRRYAFVKALAKTGLPIHICGLGWDADLYRFKKPVYEGPVSMSRMSELMRRSRIVLNTNGNFGAGSHERPLSTLLAGAASFSDYSRYYGEVFEDGRDITLFRWMEVRGGLDRLQALAADAAAAHATAVAGKAKVLAGHTWDSRIERVLEAAGLPLQARAAA